MYSGAVPEGDEGFETLKRLGVRTVISVDGMPPDLKRARQHGLRYVHLPFGYDGCPLPTANAIVKAVRDLPGPVYLHCHHGQRRSPTAAAFVRIALDGTSNEEAAKEMERAGASKDYIGLYGDVKAFRAPKASELNALKVKFRELSPTPPMMAAMVEMDEWFARLKKSAANSWKPAAERDEAASPAHQALQLREQYTELLRTQATKSRSPEFIKMMTDGEKDAIALEEALRASRPQEATQALGRVAAGCGACHTKYRNVPQTGSK
jgi:protein tyrosine phosphatase (PTP) superfamily phosphohydrolase (DUF442 family)